MATQFSIKQFYVLPTENTLDLMNVSQNKQWRLPSIHYAVYIVTGLPPLPKPFFHTLQSIASSFKLKWPSSTCLRLLPRLSTHYIFAPTSLVV